MFWCDGFCFNSDPSTPAVDIVGAHRSVHPYHGLPLLFFVYDRVEISISLVFSKLVLCFLLPRRCAHDHGPRRVLRFNDMDHFQGAYVCFYST